MLLQNHNNSESFLTLFRIHNKMHTAAVSVWLQWATKWLVGWLADLIYVLQLKENRIFINFSRMKWSWVEVSHLVNLNETINQLFVSLKQGSKPNRSYHKTTLIIGKSRCRSVCFVFEINLNLNLNFPPWIWSIFVCSFVHGNVF